jgi:hypothetical protein
MIFLRQPLVSNAFHLSKKEYQQVKAIKLNVGNSTSLYNFCIPSLNSKALRTLWVYYLEEKIYKNHTKI